jgi:phospholipid/cholesterol/gamma-HCH transport system permease protein
VQEPAGSALRAPGVRAQESGASDEVEDVGPQGRVVRAATVALSGELSRATAVAALAEVEAALAERPVRLQLDLSGVGDFDSAGLAVLVEAVRMGREVGSEVRLEGLPGPLGDCLALLSVDRLTARDPERARRGAMAAVGAMVLPGLDGLGQAWRLLRRSVADIVVGPLRGRSPRLDRSMVEFDHAANGAAPITALIAFLLGLVLALQAWVQLRAWSAELFVANMVGVAVVTEIGPLMTAIVLAARSASANAAQLGSMVVGEEIDALRQMGIDPQRYLVVPKVLSLTLAAVALCVLFDVVAICGAVLFSWGFAEIGPEVFRAQLEIAVTGSDVLTGLLKCGIFGCCIGAIGCAQGLGVEGGSAGVGRATTRAVVLSVLTVICVDAAFVILQRTVVSS